MDNNSVRVFEPDIKMKFSLLFVKRIIKDLGMRQREESHLNDFRNFYRL